MRFLHAGVTICAFTTIFAVLCLLGALITGIMDITLNGAMRTRASGGLLAIGNSAAPCRTFIANACTEIE